MIQLKCGSALSNKPKWPFSISMRWKVIDGLIAFAILTFIYFWWPVHMHSVLSYDAKVAGNYYLDLEHGYSSGTFASESGIQTEEGIVRKMGRVQAFSYVRSYADVALTPTIHVFRVKRRGRWAEEDAIVGHSKVEMVYRNAK